MSVPVGGCILLLGQLGCGVTVTVRSVFVRLFASWSVLIGDAVTVVVVLCCGVVV